MVINLDGHLRLDSIEEVLHEVNAEVNPVLHQKARSVDRPEDCGVNEIYGSWVSRKQYDRAVVISLFVEWILRSLALFGDRAFRTMQSAIPIDRHPCKGTQGCVGSNAYCCDFQ